MKQFVQILLVSLAIGASSPAMAGARIVKVRNPAEILASAETDMSVQNELANIQWNRWVSKNFIVCSIDDKQAKYLNEHLELIKNWELTRWGLPDVDFQTPCKLIVVDKPDLFKKLFAIDSTKVDIRYDENGNLKESIIFLLSSDAPSKTIPIPLSEVCLAHFAAQQKAVLNTWTYRGMGLLSGSISQVKDNVTELKKVLDQDQRMFFTKSLLEMKAGDYRQMKPEMKTLYDQCAMAFVLMVRKEYGQDKYVEFLKQTSLGGSEKAAKTVLGQESYDKFDEKFKQFLVSLTRDVAAGRTPDQYFQIIEKAN